MSLALRRGEGVLPRAMGLVAVLTLGCAMSGRPGPEARGAVGYGALPAGLDRDPARIEVPPLAVEVRAPERLALAPDVWLYLVPDRTVSLVTLQALIPAGRLHDPAQKVGLAGLTFELLAAAGAGELSADALDEQLDALAINASGSAGQEYATVSFDFRSQELPRVAPIFADVVLRPRFDADRVGVAIRRHLESVRRRPDWAATLATRALRKAVYGPDSPLGREPTEQTLQRLEREDLVAFHQAALGQAPLRLMVSGDVDRDEVLALLRPLFKDWRAGPQLPLQVLQPPAVPRRVFLVSKEVAQAKIRLGAVGLARLDPREHATRVMNHALGAGMGAGRLFREIRDRRGLAYTAASSLHPAPGRGLFQLTVDTDPSSAAEAIEAALEILADVAGRAPLTPDEIGFAKDRLLNSFAFRFESAERVALEKAVSDLLGYPDDHLARYSEEVRRVDPAAALEAARAVLRPEALQLVVVGPAGLAGSLERFGPVTILTDVDAFE
jgi:zinc protease